MQKLEQTTQEKYKKKNKNKNKILKKINKNKSNNKYWLIEHIKFEIEQSTNSYCIPKLPSSGISSNSL